MTRTARARAPAAACAGVSLYDAIAACGDLLIRFGGHALAAGLSVREGKPARVPQGGQRVGRAGAPGAQAPGAAVDAPLALSGLEEEDVAALSVLAPFGHGNPTPVFFAQKTL